jgi:hypothetical protein
MTANIFIPVFNPRRSGSRLLAVEMSNFCFGPSARNKARGPRARAVAMLMAMEGAKVKEMGCFTVRS